MPVLRDLQRGVRVPVKELWFRRCVRELDVDHLQVGIVLAKFSDFSDDAVDSHAVDLFWALGDLMFVMLDFGAHGGCWTVELE